jgi:hypothetical protein
MNYTDQWKGQSDNGMNFQVQPIIMLWNLITVNPNWLDLSKRENSYLVNLCWYLMSTK